jgi:hypothetical protein
MINWLGAWVKQKRRKLSGFSFWSGAHSFLVLPVDVNLQVLQPFDSRTYISDLMG